MTKEEFKEIVMEANEAFIAGENKGIQDERARIIALVEGKRMRLIDSLSITIPDGYNQALTDIVTLLKAGKE